MNGYRGLCNRGQDSIVREGDLVSYVVAHSNVLPANARFEAICGGESGSMFYTSRGGMTAYSESPRGLRLPRTQLDKLLRSDQLKQVCASRPAPDWELVSKTPDDDLLMLDTNSLRHEDGLLMGWTGKRFGKPRPSEEDLLAFISQTQQRLGVACEGKSVKVTSYFEPEPNDAVKSGKIFTKAELLPLEEASEDMRHLFDAICAGADDWLNLPRAPSTKALLSTSVPPEASPQVLAAIKALSMPAPARTLRRVNYRYDAVTGNRSRFENIAVEELLP